MVAARRIRGVADHGGADPRWLSARSAGREAGAGADRISDAQAAAFSDAVPVGAKLRLFGAITIRPPAGQATDRVRNAAQLFWEALPTTPLPRATNYRRWWNAPWSVVEDGGQRNAGDWTAGRRHAPSHSRTTRARGRVVDSPVDAQRSPDRRGEGLRLVDRLQLRLDRRGARALASGDCGRGRFRGDRSVRSVRRGPVGGARLRIRDARFCSRARSPPPIDWPGSSARSTSRRAPRGSTSTPATPIVTRARPSSSASTIRCASAARAAPANRGSSCRERRRRRRISPATCHTARGGC